MFYSLSLRITDTTASCVWTDKLFFLACRREKERGERRGRERRGEREGEGTEEMRRGKEDIGE